MHWLSFVLKEINYQGLNGYIRSELFLVYLWEGDKKYPK